MLNRRDLARNSAKFLVGGALAGAGFKALGPKIGTAKVWNTDVTAVVQPFPKYSDTPTYSYDTVNIEARPFTDFFRFWDGLYYGHGRQYISDFCDNAYFIAVYNLQDRTSYYETLWLEPDISVVDRALSVRGPFIRGLTARSITNKSGRIPYDVAMKCLPIDTLAAKRWAVHKTVSGMEMYEIV